MNTLEEIDLCLNCNLPVTETTAIEDFETIDDGTSSGANIYYYWCNEECYNQYYGLSEDNWRYMK